MSALSARARRFVTHFGEMGARWGVNRTVGQIYAVLFLSARPLNADELVETLGFSRSNVSMGLKELQSWRLVRLQHLPNDRRDYFSTPDDLWEIVRTLIDQRKAREIDPTLSLLRELQLERDGGHDEPHVDARIAQTAEVIELLTGWYEDMRDLDPVRLQKLLRLGTAVQAVLDVGARIGGARHRPDGAG